MWQALLLSCLLAFVSAQSTDVSLCTNENSSGSLPLNAYIEDCLSPPCALPQLQDVVINIIFRAPRTMTAMTTLATAHLSLGIFPITIPYPLGENGKTCNFLTNTYCPVLKDEVVQYTLKMYIEPSFPLGTSTTIEFRVVDESNPGVQTPVFCIRVPIIIVGPVENRLANSTRTEE